MGFFKRKKRQEPARPTQEREVPVQRADPQQQVPPPEPYAPPHTPTKEGIQKVELRERKVHAVDMTVNEPEEEVPRPDQVTPEGWPVLSIDPDALDRTPEIAEAIRQAPGVTDVKTGPLIHEEWDLPMIVRFVVERQDMPPVPVVIDVIPPSSFLVPRGAMALNLRSIQMFRYSPVAIYSAYPIDEKTKYILAGSFEALFESHLMIATDQVPFEERAATVPPLVKEFFGFDLDYTPESLHDIDTVLGRLHWCDDTPVTQATALALGAYVGEVFIRHFDGRWAQSEMFDYPVVELPMEEDSQTTYMASNTIGKVVKQINAMDGDETYWMFESLKDHLRKRHASPEELAPTGEVFAFIPEGWPQIAITSDDEGEEIRNVSTSLMAASLGNIRMYAKFQSDLAESTVPILVWGDDRPWVPVYVWLWPFKDEDWEPLSKHVAAVRAVPEFRKARMAYYSRYPVLDEMDYLYSDRPGALLFAQVVGLFYRGVSPQDLNQHLPALLEEFYGVPADYSPGSLVILDAATRDLEMREDGSVLQPPMLALSIYLGEVLNRHAGTEWVPESFEHQRPVVVRGNQGLDLMGIIGGSVKKGGPERSYADFPRHVEAVLGKEEGA